MLLSTIILGIVCALLLFLLLLYRQETKSIAQQLRELKRKETNALLHTENAFALELTREINALLKETREGRAHYAKKQHDLEQMMTNISHDLRTPLTSAMGYLDIILRTDLPAPEKERELAIVAQRLHRLEELINSFFEFSQVIAGEGRPEKKELNLIGVLEESIAHYYDDYCAKNRAIMLDCAPGKLPISSNQNMLLRIFDNLIGNSLKHGEGTLTISVRLCAQQKNYPDMPFQNMTTISGNAAISAGRFVAIRFENTLSGAQPDIDRIFDEFYTTDISRTKGNTGLGLAIAKQFTQMLGGRISASYEEGRFAVVVEF